MHFAQTDWTSVVLERNENVKRLDLELEFQGRLHHRLAEAKGAVTVTDHVITIRASPIELRPPVRVAPPGAATLRNAQGTTFETRASGKVLASIIQRRLHHDEEVAQRVANMQATAAEAEDKLKRLYTLVENGAIAIHEVLRQRIQLLQAIKAKADAALERAVASGTPTSGIAADQIARFGQITRDKLDNGDVNVKRVYIASVVSAI